jgi:hypothetical protein
MFNIKERLLTEDNMEDKQFELFINMNLLLKSQEFLVTDEKLVIWSKQSFFHGDLDSQDSKINSNEGTIILKKGRFEIPPLEEASIAMITAMGMNLEDIAAKNYYVYLKINFDTYSTYIKYNINKEKEFSSFDCSQQALVFFDSKQEGYILDTDSIIDID